MTWKVEIDKVSSAVPMEPTQADLLKEAQLERKRLDRIERLRLDPVGLGTWGVQETIDEVVRRQNGRR
jgi:hypothetical protein